MRPSRAILPLFPDSPGRASERAGRNGSRVPRTAPEAGASRGTRPVRFRPLACASILNECANPGLPFRWTINPYRGCQFGCSYCFARYTHAYLDQTEPGSFEERIYVKFQAAQVLAETLRPALVRGRPIALGTATDPYQPAEKRFGITRRLLEVLARCPDVDLSITTKSTLIERDVDLLRKIAACGRVRVHVTLLNLNPTLTRIVERCTPPPRLRLETIRVLHSAGIEVGLFVMPVMPGVNDSPDDLRSLLRAAKTVGATYAVADPLRLFGPSWVAFEPILRRHFPHLIPQYRCFTEKDGRLPAEVARLIRDRFEAIRSAVGLGADACETGESRSCLGPGWLFADLVASCKI